MTDTQLQYFGRLRKAEHCGTLNGHDVFFLDVDLLAPREEGSFGRAIVRRSRGTTEQTSPIFLGSQDNDIDSIADVQWSSSPAAERAKAWVASECTERGEKLIRLAGKLRGVQS